MMHSHKSSITRKEHIHGNKICIIYRKDRKEQKTKFKSEKKMALNGYGLVGNNFTFN